MGRLDERGIDVHLVSAILGGTAASLLELA
jgi:hypothetical protein